MSVANSDRLSIALAFTIAITITITITCKANGSANDIANAKRHYSFDRYILMLLHRKSLTRYGTWFFWHQIKVIEVNIWIFTEVQSSQR